MLSRPSSLKRNLPASEKQLVASDPKLSVWVAASAGSGKTKILIDRVLRLLMTGTRPEGILCLTFTKAAATEMAARIAQRLSDWSLYNDQQLRCDLTELSGKKPDLEDLNYARKLFATVIDAGGRLQVQTIHGFCQSILKRFPTEAGLSPQFDVIDDRTVNDYLRMARDLVIQKARTEEYGSVNAALEEITKRIGEDSLTALLDELIGARHRLKHIFGIYNNDMVASQKVREELGVKLKQTDLDLLEEYIRDETLDITSLVFAAKGLKDGSKTDIAKGELVLRWLGNSEYRLKHFSEYKSVFLTQSNEMRVTLATKKVIDNDPKILDILKTEAQRLLSLEDKRKTLDLALRTESLLLLVRPILEFYQRTKINNSVVDYDDLIVMTRDLLKIPGIGSWVLFKLDGGVDHVLVDEAQDTNPEQWQVIEALTDDFFSEQHVTISRESSPRTVFVVGDVKQSIFSFQRAEPSAFNRMRDAFSKKVIAAEGGWRDIDLDISYRSSVSVLKAVDAVFNTQFSEKPPGYGLIEFQEDDRTSISHHPFRKGQEGVVELWDIEPSRETPARDPWALPTRQIAYEHPSRRLAKKISATVRRWLDEGEFLESRGRPIRPNDIMILVRQRGQFVLELVRALKEMSIPVSGVDRMVLTEQLAVMDLIAFGKFLLLPEDDLNLAVVLKSPLIGISEEDLLELCWNRGEQHLWIELGDRAEFNKEFLNAYSKLFYWLKRAGSLSPYELFSEVLDSGARRSLLERLGVEANDPIDELLLQALEYERSHVSSLEGFLHWLSTGDFEVKRDMETQELDQIRLLTVHGSKGLQAPIVFLPDTMRSSGKLPKILWTESRRGMRIPLWAPTKQSDTSFTTAMKEMEADKRDKEYHRLLYVAMTRAEDRLYIGGWRTQNKAYSLTWYDMMKSALEPIAKNINDKLVLSCKQIELPDKEESRRFSKVNLSELPHWALSKVKSERTTLQAISPSQIEEETEVILPFNKGNVDAFLRGKIIHTLLQRLPKFPRGERKIIGKEYLSQAAHNLTLKAQEEYLSTAMNVLNKTEFQDIFSSDGMVEVPISGHIKKNDKLVRVVGRIDRLVILDSEALVVDYKTSRAPPKNFKDLSSSYRKQMAIYSALVKEIYPDLSVRCMVLWTDVPSIMEIPNNFLKTNEISF